MKIVDSGSGEGPACEAAKLFAVLHFGGKTSDRGRGDKEPRPRPTLRIRARIGQRICSRWLVAGVLPLFVTLLTAEVVRDITEPYRFPLRPGEPGWRLLKSGHEQAAAVDIPEGTVRRMTTDALLESCVNYPLKTRIITSNISHADGFETMLREFSGVRELLSREDGPSLLALRYKSMAHHSKAGPPPVLDHLVVCHALQRRGILDALPEEELVAVAKCALRIAKSFRDAHGHSADEAPALQLAVRIVVNKQVSIFSATKVLSRKSLNLDEMKHFLREDIWYIPEKEHVEILIDFASNLPETVY